MAGKRKLSIEQWATVDRRLINGEPIRHLAREYGVSDGTIRARIKKAGKSETVQIVAAKIVEAEKSLAALPLSAQYTARTLAQKLMSISDSLASAAELGAYTAHRLQSLANNEVAKVDDADPMASMDNLRGVGVMTKLANESASIALNLLAANKEAVQKANAGGGQGENPVEASDDELVRIATGGG
jgi:hypothetical protein